MDLPRRDEQRVRLAQQQSSSPRQYFLQPFITTICSNTGCWAEGTLHRLGKPHRIICFLIMKLVACNQFKTAVLYPLLSSYSRRRLGWAKVPLLGLPMSFFHPLARAAKTWQAVAMDGSKRDVLVVITTLELNPDSKKYKKEKVDRLAEAAHEWLATQSAPLDSFILMSRPKDRVES